MNITLSQKLNILKSKKTFISFNIDKDKKLIEYTLNDNFVRYKPKYNNFKLLDIFKEDYILNSKQNYTLKQILKQINIY